MDETDHLDEAKTMVLIASKEAEGNMRAEDLYYQRAIAHALIAIVEALRAMNARARGDRVPPAGFHYTELEPMAHRLDGQEEQYE